MDKYIQERILSSQKRQYEHKTQSVNIQMSTDIYVTGWRLGFLRVCVWGGRGLVVALFGIRGNQSTNMIVSSRV